MPSNLNGGGSAVATCAVGGAGGDGAATHALAACEVPPTASGGDGGGRADGDVGVALVSRDGGGRGTERRDAVATVAGSIPEETSNALWIEYLAPAVGGGDGRGDGGGGTARI